MCNCMRCCKGENQTNRPCIYRNSVLLHYLNIYCNLGTQNIPPYIWKMDEMYTNVKSVYKKYPINPCTTKIKHFCVYYLLQERPENVFLQPHCPLVWLHADPGKDLDASQTQPTKDAATNIIDIKLARKLMKNKYMPYGDLMKYYLLNTTQYS